MKELEGKKLYQIISQISRLFQVFTAFDLSTYMLPKRLGVTAFETSCQNCLQKFGSALLKLHFTSFSIAL